MPESRSFNIDCMEGMASIPTKFFDLAIVDPPYGLNQNIAKVKSRCKLASTPVSDAFDWDQKLPTREYFSELERVSKNQIIWGANYFASICEEVFTAPRRQRYSDFIQANPTNWIIWDKVNGGSDFSDCELAYCSKPIETCIFRFMWAGMMQGKSIAQGHVMQGNKALNEVRIHPTQKPVALYRWILHHYATPGMRILDTHMGSQSSRIAAYHLQLDYWGFEIFKKYYKEGNQRFQEQTAQLSFFKQ